MRIKSIKEILNPNKFGFLEANASLMTKMGVIVLLFLAQRFPLNGQTIVFESGFEEWENGLPIEWVGSQTTISPDSIMQWNQNPYEGQYCCRLINRSTVYKMFSSQAFPIVTGCSYEFSLRIKGKCNFSQEGSLILELIYGDTTVQLRRLSAGQNSWMPNSGTFVAGSSGIAELVIKVKSTIELYNDILLDDFKVKRLNSPLLINNILADIGNKGHLFSNEANNGLFNVPMNSSKTTIYIGNLWIGAKRENSETIFGTFGEYNGENSEGFEFGPIGNQYLNSSYDNQYNRTWTVSRAEINYHREHFNDEGYSINYTIAEWPGNGNVENGEAQFLAPFMDVNQNDTYDPQNGDYPLIRGDMALFFISNDDRTSQFEGSSKMGVEVHGMLYGYDRPEDSALFNTLFLKYKLFNRSNFNYNEMYVGHWFDFDIGSFNDDLMGTDSANNMIYGYNADNIDGWGQAWEYGEHPPAQGAMVLNYPINKALCNTVEFGTPTGEPGSLNNYYNRMKGMWSDGTPLTYGGIGWGGQTPVNFMYSGVPELETGWIQSESRDLRSLMSVGPFSFNAGDNICIDLAFPFACDYTGTNLTSLALLRERAVAIQNFYNSQNFNCGEETVQVRAIQGNRQEGVIYPNPGKGRFTIESNMMQFNLKLYNVHGDLVYSSTGLNGNNGSEVSLEIPLENGLYLYRLMDINGKSVSGKLLVQ